MEINFGYGYWRCLNWKLFISLGLASCLASCASLGGNNPLTPAAPSPANDPGLNNKTAGNVGPTERLERAIAQDLPKEIGVPIQSVSCPKQQTLEVGRVFDCEAKIAAGTFPVKVTVKNADGQITLKTSQILLLAEAEMMLQKSIKQTTGADVRANCGGKVKLIKTVGERIPCKLTGAQGKSGTATITVTNQEGKVDAKWKL